MTARTTRRSLVAIAVLVVAGLAAPAAAATPLDVDPNAAPDPRCAKTLPVPPQTCVAPRDPWEASRLAYRALDACWALGSQQPGHLCDPQHSGVRVGPYTASNPRQLLDDVGAVYASGEGEVRLGRVGVTGQPLVLVLPGETAWLVRLPSEENAHHHACLDRAYAEGSLRAYLGCMAGPGPL